ncbi:MAG: transglycosylase SLT domain-containing protein, partial [Nanoarchaeota archaeon]|nr:transglycosylase SLT domain-containing protein [Nanoarchaeota archaeon]
MEEGKKKKKFFRTLGAAVLVGLGLGNANAGDKNQDMNAQNADNNSIRFEYIDTSGNRDREELPKVLEAREGKNLPVNNSQMPYKENPQPQIINKENPQNDILNNNIKSRVGNPNAEYPEGGFEEPISEEGLSYIKYNADKFVRTLEVKRNDIYDRLGSGGGAYKKIIDENGFIDFSSLVPARSYTVGLYAKKFDINPKLYHVLAIAETNYGFKKSKSSKGADGVMQVMPETLARFSKNGDHYEAAANLIIFLGKKFKINVRYDSNMNNMEIAVIAAGYNAGEGNVEKKSDKIFLLPNWFKETKEYIRLVLSGMNENKL